MKVAKRSADYRSEREAVWPTAQVSGWARTHHRISSSPQPETARMKCDEPMEFSRFEAMACEGRRKDVFQRWGSVQIDFRAEVPDEVVDRADQFFLRLQPHLRTAKMEEKRKDWHSIYHAFAPARC